MPRFSVSVDFELFEDTFAFQRLGEKWGSGENGEAGIERLLALFEKYNVRSTFFIVAGHAKSHQGLINSIRSKGHEIASHTVTHPFFRNCAPSRIAEEIRDSKKILEDVSGAEVMGFRTPAFRLNGEVAKIIEQSGYKYDSSVVPCWAIPGWYGTPGAPFGPFRLKKLFPGLTSGLMEIPVAVNPLLRLPVSGAWMRLFGIEFTMWGIRLLVKRGVAPVLYVHPWEMVNLPKIEGIKPRVYFRTGEKTASMVEHILKKTKAEFVPLYRLLEDSARKPK